MASEDFSVSDEMRARIGSKGCKWNYEVTTTSVRMFARGVGYTDPVYYDREAARAAGYRDLPAPPTYLGTPVFIPGQSSDTFSGPIDGTPTVDHGLSGLLDGGTETEYFDTVCAGDTLEVEATLADLKVAASKALGKMLIVQMETTYTNVDTGKLAARQRSQVIYY